MMYDVFITGTFRNDWNKTFNTKVAELLEKNNLKCYLPQKDTDQSGNRKRTFQENVSGVSQSKMLMAIGTKTQTANWGFEIGQAFSLKKNIIILTDHDHPVALMTEGAATNIITVKDLDDMDSYAPELLSLIKSNLATENK